MLYYCLVVIYSIGQAVIYFYVHGSGYICVSQLCAGSLDIIDTHTCSHVQTVPGLGFSIDSVSISCSGTHTAIAVATQSSGTFGSSIQTNNIAILLATEGCSWERRALLPHSENKVYIPQWYSTASSEIFNKINDPMLYYH